MYIQRNVNKQNTVAALIKSFMTCDNFAMPKKYTGRFLLSIIHDILYRDA